MTLLLVVLVPLACTARPPHHGDPASARVDYWRDQPASIAVTASDYDALWNAATGSLDRFGFEAALTDYRGGRLTSQPLVGSFPLEIWRSELRDTSSIAESTLSTVQRRIEFDLRRNGSRFTLEPRVIVERRSLGERRITSAIDYGRILGTGQERGTKQGQDSDGNDSYWYAIGRDAALERSLANRIAQRTGGVIETL
ncbi:MAG: hypothetical protein AAGK78_04805 [Planctomycetota bacterium]